MHQPPSLKPLDWSGCPLITREAWTHGWRSGNPRMRITPETILMHWEDGMNFEEIHDCFGGVTIEDAKAIVDYAEARGLSVLNAA